jgi:hypothetical protein
MNELLKNTKPETDIEAMSRQRQSLDYVRQELLEYRPDIVDDSLRARVTVFLSESADRPPGSAREYISRELHDIREDNAMRRRTGVTNAESEFPDRCKGCDHYGVRCPVMTKTSEMDRLDRIFRETNDPDELRRTLRTYAIDNGCHIIKDAIDEIVEKHEPLAAEGQLLLMLVEETLHYGSTEEQVARMLTNRIQQIRQQRLDDTPDDTTGLLEGFASETDGEDGHDVSPDAPDEAVADGGEESG